MAKRKSQTRKPKVEAPIPTVAWHKVFNDVKPHVVRIATPGGSGTGFLLTRSSEGVLAIATATHVIADAHMWEQPIRIDHFASGKSTLLKANNRSITLSEQLDTAAIVCECADIEFPDETLRLAPANKSLKIGCAIGWVGFPAVSASNLCFFSGHISAFKAAEHAYLVDGVAINGVSGGPVVFNMPKTTLIGVMSAYIPNRATGLVLPGLSEVRDISHLQEVVAAFRTLDEAKAKETPPTELPSPAKSTPPANGDPSRDSAPAGRR